MDESTYPEAGGESPRMVAWCSWCDGVSDTVRLVAFVEQGTGPGGSLYACQPCRDVHGLIPVADR